MDLNWIVFDKNMVPLVSGFKQLTTAAREYGQNATHEKLELTNSGGTAGITITEPGYVYIYLSNESTTTIEVYFDDFKVRQEKSAVIQWDDYYAFGLAFNSYQRENYTPNQFLYNGKEKQEELGIDWLDYGARMYMPEIGRWGVVDQYADIYLSLSPYNYVANNPLLLIDPDGNTIVDSQGNIVSVEYDKEGNISKVNGTEDQNLINLITTTFTHSDTGKETVQRLLAEGTTFQILIHDKGAIFESEYGGYGTADGLSSPDPEGKYDVQIDIYGNKSEDTYDMNKDNFESNYDVYNMYGEKQENIGDKRRDKIIQSVNKGEGSERHTDHQSSLNNLTPDQRARYEAAQQADRNNPLLRSTHTLIYETANSMAGWGDAGETTGKVAVGSAYQQKR